MKRYVQSHILRKAGLAVTLVMVGIFALAIVGGTAFAQSHGQEGKDKHGLFGTVLAKGAGTLTLQTKQGATVVLKVDAASRFYRPDKTVISLSDVALGSRVAVLAQGEAGAQTVLRVMLVPGQPQSEHRALTVVEVSGKTLIAEDAQGKRIQVELDHEITSDVKGQLIIFIGARSQQSNRFKANVEVKIGQVVKRLETHAQKLEAEAKVEANAQVKARKEKDLAELKARLEANMQRHLELFAEIIAKAPEQAKASLEAALQLSLNGYKTALGALGDSKTNAEVRLRLRTVHGSVEAVNAQANEITVKSDIDTNLTLKVSGDTRILIGEEAGDLSKISVGDQVAIRYNAATSLAAEIRVRAEAKAHGTIQTVDTAKDQLVIALANGATLTLKLTPGTRIEVNHKKSAAADLKANASVEVEFNNKTMVARKVEASSRAEVKGTVKAVDSAAGIVTIHTEAGKDVTVKVTSATRVDIQGLLFGILGVNPGMAIKAEFDLATGEAAELKVRAEGHGEGQVRAEAKVHGAIASIDSTNGKLTVNLDGGGTLTLRVTGDTQIQFNSQRVALANLQTGARSKIEYNAETLIASEIDARSRPQVQLEAEVHGTIQALDATKHAMTVRLRDGSTKELVLNADTVIRISGQPSAEADLKPGMELEARFRTDTGAALRINTTAKVETEAEVRGEVKNVNPFAGQLVVETADGKSVVVSLDNTTRITRSGLLITLLGITAGAQVKIQLQIGVSGNVAQTVEVLGTPGASLEVGASGQASVSGSRSAEIMGSGQASASGGPGAKGEASAAAEIKGSGQASASGGPSAKGEASAAAEIKGSGQASVSGGTGAKSEANAGATLEVAVP